MYLQYILPAIITVLANALFYISIKKKVDNTIEKFKISYSGVFKEKIDIYKKLLCEVNDLKLKLNQFQYYDDAEFKSEIQKSFNNLIKLYSVNLPFLSIKLVELIRANTKELQDIFENMYLGKIVNYGMMQPEEIRKRELQYWSAINKLRENKVLATIEESIIQEMRSDLHTS